MFNFILSLFLRAPHYRMARAQGKAVGYLNQFQKAHDGLGKVIDELNGAMDEAKKREERLKAKLHAIGEQKFHIDKEINKTIKLREKLGEFIPKED